MRSAPQWIALLFMVVAFAPMRWLEGAEDRPVSFSRDIAPILSKQCQTCHGPEKSKGKFRIDSFARLTTPGKSKASPITPGEPRKSELYKLITAEDEDDRMPQKADRLPDAQIATIRRWIEQGAKFDGSDPAASLSTLTTPSYPRPPEAYGRPAPITALAFSPDGKVLAASGYHEITLWDPTTGRVVGRLQDVALRTQALAYSPDGHWLAAASGTPGTVGEVKLFDLTTTPPAARSLERLGDMMCAVRFSPDGTRLAAGGADNVIRVYDVSTGKQQLRIEQHADWVTDLAFSPDGSKLASASRDKSCRVFDAQTGAMESAFLDSEEAVYAVAWGDEGKRIYSAGRDRTIRAWNAADARPTGQITGLNADVFRLECSGGLLLACTGDGVVNAYAETTRKLVRTFPGITDWVYSLTIDAKNHRIAAGCFSGEVRVWNLDDASAISRFIAAPGYEHRKN